MKALSPTDSAFLWLETRNQPMHVAGLNIYTPPADAPPHFISGLLADWGRHLKARAPFNLRPVLRLGLWHWEEDKDFELDYHLRHLALPYPGRIRELLAMVSRLHGNLLDRNRPLWEAYVIEGLPGGRFAIYTKIHHALVDGVTGAKVMAEGLTRDPRERRPPLWDMELAALKHASGRTKAAPGLVKQLIDAAKAGREILPGVTSGVWDILRAQIPGISTSSSAASEAGLPFQAPPTPFNVEISGSRRFAAQSYSLARLKRIGAASGATVNDVTLAICAGALRKYLLQHHELPKRPLVAMVPVSLHGDTDEGGNQVTLILARLATHLADPLMRLRHIMQSTAAAKVALKGKPRLQKMAHGMTSIAPMGPAMLTGVARKHPGFNLVISNVPGPKETLYLEGARLDEVYPVSIPTHYLALNITISGYGDHLGFGYTACRRSVPSLQRMLDHTDESIAELEQALAAPAPKPKAPARKAAAPAKAATQAATQTATKNAVKMARTVSRVAKAAV